ncbi:MAG: NAD-dependent epimerase/dehydratase family protein [Polyangiales bacterium]
MKVMLTGISSPIAKLVAAELVGQGDTVIGVDRRPWDDAPAGVEMHAIDVRKRAAEELIRHSQPEAIIHMATVTHLVAATEERYRINLGGTRAVFEHANEYGVEHVIFVGRHTYYGAGAEQALYHHEDDPPMAVSTFPELADLVAADLYAAQSLWRFPKVATSVLRFAYSLGPTGHGTLASFLKGRYVPTVLGFDPLFQFMHERDVADAICATLRARLRGVFNVAGPQPLPLSVIIRETGRKNIPLPEVAFQLMRGRFGLPRLPPGAVQHIKHPVVIDGGVFSAATGWKHSADEVTCIGDFTRAFPPPV